MHVDRFIGYTVRRRAAGGPIEFQRAYTCARARIIVRNINICTRTVRGFTTVRRKPHFIAPEKMAIPVYLIPHYAQTVENRNGCKTKNIIPSPGEAAAEDARNGYFIYNIVHYLWLV